MIVLCETVTLIIRDFSFVDLIALIAHNHDIDIFIRKSENV